MSAARALLGAAALAVVDPVAGADPAPATRSDADHVVAHPTVAGPLIEAGSASGTESPAPVATPIGADPAAATPSTPAFPMQPSTPESGARVARAVDGPPGLASGAEPVHAPAPYTGGAGAAPEPAVSEPVWTAVLVPGLPSLSPAGADLAVPELPAADEPIRPVPDTTGAEPEKVALGRALFHDPRLSKDNTTACVSCHDLGHGGDDGRAVSVGVEGRTGPINAPTVFNAGLNFRQFWDGRAETLEQQIDGPVQSPVELGSLWPEVIAKLYEHESYPARFNALYPDSITRENVKNALATYMRSLTTPNSRFDRWLGGEADALSANEKRGYALFKHYGCVSCHQGANVGGNMFQVFGVLNDYFRKRGNITDVDLGRFNVTGNPADRHAFKVPSLRMAALTAPYLHDGSAATLRDAVDAMFEFQLGREAPDEDKDAIVAFIETLAGENRELAP